MRQQRQQLQFKREDLDAQEYALSIGVDEITVVPMLSNRAVVSTGWTDVYVPSLVELQLAGAEDALRNDSGWERLHVTVSVLTPSCIAWTARMWRLTDGGDLHVTASPRPLFVCGKYFVWPRDSGRDAQRLAHDLSSG